MFVKAEKSLFKLLPDNKKRLFSNFFHLYILLGINYILPVITIPYLIRVLGAEMYGIVVFAQAFTQYFVILTDFGFNISATRQVSLHHNDPKKLSEIFCSVMISKLMFLAISFLILILILQSFDKFGSNWQVYIYGFGIVIGSVMFPVWFFQGLEKMNYISLITSVSRITYTVLLFLLIKEPSDFSYVMLLFSIGSLLSGILSLWFCFKHLNIKLVLPGFRRIWKDLSDSSHFFVTNASMSAYTTCNILLLGLFTSNNMVSFYAIAEKMHNAVNSLFNPVSSSLYPYMCKAKEITFFKKIFYIIAISNIGFRLVLIILADYIVLIVFGSHMEDSVPIFRVLSLAGFFIVPSMLLGVPFLTALKHSIPYNLSIILGVIFHVIGIAILYLSFGINIYSIAILTVITEFMMLYFRIIAVKILGLWKTGENI